MAKFTITFENETIKKELIFKGEKFDFTMEPFKFGMKANKASFLNQFEDKFGNIDDDLAEHLENLDFGNETEIQTAIEYLTDLEECIY